MILTNIIFVFILNTFLFYHSVHCQEEGIDESVDRWVKSFFFGTNDVSNGFQVYVRATNEPLSEHLFDGRFICEDSLYIDHLSLAVKE